ncbi:MAG: hypothetical protein E7262_03805 [Lachnospiraceae bacterium]|nr:hypothetical protein [Lachnospiraceae bacterium]
MFFVIVSGVVFFIDNYNSSNDILLEDVMQESAVIETDDSSVDNYDSDKTIESDKSKDRESSKNDDKSSSREYIYVHICGEIKTPGVYKLLANSRAVDVIELAGGLTDKADSVAINQANLIQDGEQIYIPKIGEKVTSLSKEGDDGLNQSLVSGNSGDSDKVNINTASKIDLVTLPGIGEAKADMIINYRTEKGSFSKIEDIMNITGIKEGLFNKISEYITV